MSTERFDVVILGVLGILFLVLARFCLGYMERRAREEGRLTVRAQ